MSRPGPLLNRTQAERVFVAFYDEKMSLSAIGRELGVDYTIVGRTLRGDGHYGPLTADLRAGRPPYQPRQGRGLRRSTLDDDVLGGLFVSYYEERLSLDAVAAKYGVARQTIRDLLSGSTGAEQTAPFREKYGSTIRSRGRPIPRGRSG